MNIYADLTNDMFGDFSNTKYTYAARQFKR